MIFFLERVFLKWGEIIDLGVDFEIIKKSGSWFSYGTSKLGQGRDTVKQLLLDNPDLMDELEMKVRAAVTGEQALVGGTLAEQV